MKIKSIVISALIVTALTCSTVFAAQLPTPKNTVRVIAHRGASGYAPENTMAAFRKALEMGAEMIEFDVHRTSDGKFVIMHDGETDRTTGVKGKIAEMTLEQIEQLDAGSWFSKDFTGEKVPTLSQVLEWAKGKIQVNIEIKSEGCEEEVVRLINKLDTKNETIVTSFHHEFLKKIKELDPEIITGALIGDVKDEKQLDDIIAACAPNALNPRYINISKSNVKWAHTKGLAVNIYTVNDTISMQRLIKFGADGIITNYPDVLLTTIEKIKNAPSKKTQESN